MKCAKSKKLIYLYNELDPGERSLLDRHLSTCKACRLLLAEVQTYQEKMQQFLSIQASADVRLTDRIMNEVIASKRKIETSRWNLPAFTRYQLAKAAFAVLSFSLVAWFTVDVNHPTPATFPDTVQYAGANLKSVELNSKVFNDRSDSLTEKYFIKSLATCLSVCKNKDQQTACEDCQSRIKKLRTLYANI